MISSYPESCPVESTAGEYFSHNMIRGGERIWWSEDTKALTILSRSLVMNNLLLISSLVF